MTMYHRVLNYNVVAFLKHNSIKEKLHLWMVPRAIVNISKSKFSITFQKLSFKTKILLQTIYNISFQIKLTSYILVSNSPLIFSRGIRWLSCSKYCSAR